MKNILLASFLFSICSFSISANTNSKISYDVDTNNNLVQYDCMDCFPKNILDLRDNDQEKMATSLRYGSSLQTILVHMPHILESKIDQRALSTKFNRFSIVTAQYFKKNPDLKGIFIVNLKIYPSYKKPFSYDIYTAKTASEMEYLKKINKALLEETQCNKDHFCQALITHEIKFVSLENPKLKIDIKEFNQFVDKQHRDNFPIYTKNKHFSKPINFYLVMGTNGYLATPEKIKLALDK